jgi:hypothetical protein
VWFKGPAWWELTDDLRSKNWLAWPVTPVSHTGTAVSAQWAAVDDLHNNCGLTYILTPEPCRLRHGSWPSWVAWGQGHRVRRYVCPVANFVCYRMVAYVGGTKGRQHAGKGEENSDSRSAKLEMSVAMNYLRYPRRSLMP